LAVCFTLWSGGSLPGFGSSLALVEPTVSDHAQPADKIAQNLPPPDPDCPPNCDGSDARLAQNLPPPDPDCPPNCDGSDARLAQNLPPPDPDCPPNCDGSDARLAQNLPPPDPDCPPNCDGSKSALEAVLVPALLPPAHDSEIVVGPQFAVLRAS
jgi:hypothetical protein